MLQLGDIRKSRIYQEAMEEGKLEGQLEACRRAIARMAARNVSVADIADFLGLEIEEVRSALTMVSPTAARVPET